MPTIAEAGIPEYNHTIWIGVMAPAGTPKPIVETLNREINKILSRPEIKESWRRQGANTMVMTPEEFGRYIEAEIERWAKLIKANNIGIELKRTQKDGNQMNVQVRLPGTEHWTSKGDVKLFLWNKVAGDPAKTNGTILFVHGSSMASQPTFDLDVPGRPDSSAMEYFARQGYDCWCVDMEGYGRSTKDRDNNAPISFGADDCFAAATYIQKLRGPRPLLVYGISSGALRAGLFAERHPEMVDRLALDAHVWTGEGSPTLAERRKKLPEFIAKNRRPIDRAFVHSIFNRDHPGHRGGAA